MNRRTLLTSISVGAATVAGCIGELDRSRNETEGLASSDEEEGLASSDEDENDERRYEGCNQRVLYYRSLPNDVKTEVDTAFNEGQYETDGELLWQQVAGPGVEFLWRNGKYYTPQVDVNNGVHVLQFQETTPQYASMKHLTVDHVPEVPLNVSITIKNTDGGVLEQTDLTIETEGTDRTPGGEDEKPRAPVASKFGTYLVEVTVEDWGTVTEELSLGPHPDDIWLSIYKRSESPFTVAISIDLDDGQAVCPWEQRQ